MTGSVAQIKKSRRAAICFIICTVTCLISREELSNAILLGIKLSASSIIPGLFPFFVISDYLSCNIESITSGRLSLLFEKIFGLPRVGFASFILGSVCGFPLGIRSASELYENGKITKEECERLSVISNNPSLAFCVSVVGGGMLGDPLLGFVLYLSVLSSSIFLGLVLRKKRDNIMFSDVISKQTFNLSGSIKNAGTSSIVVSSFIIFFSGVVGIEKKLIKNKFLSLAVTSVFEIGNAANEIAHSQIDDRIKLVLLGFSLGFSGLSVFFQSLSFCPPEFSKFRILFFKALQGILSSFFVFLYLLFK